MIINARQIVVVAADVGVANVVNVTLANGGKMIKASLANFKDWLFLDAHENGPRCAQISGPTVGARQRSPAVDLLVANEAG